MAILLIDPPPSLIPEGLPHKTWTRDEIAVLESTGLFDGTHFELIEGELIDKVGKGRKHVRGTRRTAKALEALFGEEYVDREVSMDVALADNARNEPEPDVLVLRRPSDAFEVNPSPGEVALVVEVADSTFRLDIATKAALYARAGIADYWVIDVRRRRLLVFRDPADGVYRTQFELGECDSIMPLEKPSSEVRVADLLP